MCLGRFSFKPKKFRWNHTDLENPAKESNRLIKVMLAATTAPPTQLLSSKKVYVGIKVTN